PKPLLALSIDDNLKQDLQNLLEKKGFQSDVIFVVGKKKFALHKAILAARSPVFAAMFANDLEKKKQNKVNIPDISVEVFEELIRFIYTGDLVPSMEQFAFELFIAADKVF